MFSLALAKVVHHSNIIQSGISFIPMLYKYGKFKCNLFIKTIIAFMLVRYEMILTNLMVYASLAICHLTHILLVLME